MRAGRLCIAARFSRYAGLLAFMISMAYLERADAFGIVSRVTKQVFPGIQDSMSDFAEAMNGEIYANALLNQDETDSMVGETDKLLSKRVAVAIRYSADSGMKPYFLTVAKRLKETHPDIILDKVILPKVEVGDGKAEVTPTFEVMVDGKVIIPTVGKKDRDGMGGHIIFVSMQELEVAISRARRRRRPSSVYGEEEANVRLEMLKAKAAAASASHVEKGKMLKHAKD